MFVGVRWPSLNRLDELWRERERERERAEASGLFCSTPAECESEFSLYTQQYSSLEIKPEKKTSASQSAGDIREEKDSLLSRQLDQQDSSYTDKLSVTNMK